MDQTNVDLLRLREANTRIGEETKQALEPGVSDANGRIYRGVAFGEVSSSGEVAASREALAYGMARFWQNSKGHIERAKQVTAFLERILAEYDTVDELARLDVEKVKQRFAAAFPQEQSQRAESPWRRGAFE